jgi:translocation and assembly module TamA
MRLAQKPAGNRRVSAGRHCGQNGIVPRLPHGPTKGKSYAVTRFGAKTAMAAMTAVLACAGGALALDPIRFEVAGADEPLEASLRAASPLLEAERARVGDAQELFGAARAEYGRLVGVLYGAGHYSARINVRIDGREAGQIPPIDAPGTISAISVEVVPGPRFTFSEAEIAPLAPGTRLPEDLRPGGVARSTLLRDGAAAAVAGWRAAGHAKAQPGAQAIVADHGNATLSARIAISPGPAVTFGRFDVTGHEGVRLARIREIARFPEGEAFDPEALELSAQRLRRTGTFQSVALTEAEALGPGATLDVGTVLVEAPPRRIGFGADVDTVGGLRLSGFWLHRNLLGGAERLRIDAEIGSIGAQTGGIDYRVGARFSRPATLTPETTFFVDGIAESVDARDFDAQRVAVDVGLSHIFSDTLSGEAAIGYRHERLIDGAGRRMLATVALPLGLTWDRRNDSLDPTQGFFVEGRVTPFVGVRGADSGAQALIDARGYVGFGEDDRFVLAGRAQAGAVAGASLFGTPRGYLFYSGGGGSVRGQPFESLGVTSACPAGPPGCTVRSGGRGFAALSGEVRARVFDGVSVVGFVDAGYVSAGAFSGASDWHAGAGIGLRYQTGIGPLRVDVGGPVSGTTGNGPQLYIGIGQAF